ncbi:hypothetical protein F2Q70_00020730 [Brassica cretica]|uniref:Uncharacterized protein n=1 Tax=Brassica cretica TaxID=69181 RepID=A0A8S9GSG9_BRACR|nr:hypothetical protein F2Q70_00020730 [Brassica cretica]
MEETALEIIKAAKDKQVTSNYTGRSESNPATPPPVQGFSIQVLLFPDPSVLYTPPVREEEDLGFDSYYSDVAPARVHNSPSDTRVDTARIKSIIVSPLMETEETSPQGGEAVEEDTELEPHYRGETPNRTTLTLTMRHEKTMKMKSIIISPKVEKEREQEVELVPFPREQEIDNSREDTETLLEFQNKVRRLGSRSGRTRLPRNSPKILKGASSKKRRISQL